MGKQKGPARSDSKRAAKTSPPRRKGGKNSKKQDRKLTPPRAPAGNVAGAGALDPKHNRDVGKSLLSQWRCDEVIPELEVAAARNIFVKGNHFPGTNKAAVFKFQVTAEDPAYNFNEHGANDVGLALILHDVSDYSSPAMLALFGEGESAWEDITLSARQYQTMRHATWAVKPEERTLALHQHEVYHRHRQQLLASDGDGSAGSASHQPTVYAADASLLAAKEAAKATTVTPPTSVYTTPKISSSNNKKLKLRGTDSANTIVTQFTPTGHTIAKQDKEGNAYTIMLMSCNVPGCKCVLLLLLLLLLALLSLLLLLLQGGMRLASSCKTSMGRGTDCLMRRPSRRSSVPSQRRRCA